MLLNTIQSNCLWHSEHLYLPAICVTGTCRCYVLIRIVVLQSGCWELVHEAGATGKSQQAGGPEQNQRELHCHQWGDHAKVKSQSSSKVKEFKVQEPQSFAELDWAHRNWQLNTFSELKSFKFAPVIEKVGCNTITVYIASTI